ncbi:MAG: hypothetical protein ABJB47_00525 [Actinomycetota bacterium]
MPVKTILGQDLPITASVVVGAVVLWLIVGLTVGVVSATRARSAFDRLSTVGCWRASRCPPSCSVSC